MQSPITSFSATKSALPTSYGAEKNKGDIPFGVRSVSSLQNKKLSLFNKEKQAFKQVANMKAFIDRVGDKGSLNDAIKLGGVHKFVLNDEGQLNIGTINGAHTKSLSHPVLANNLGGNIIAAGYIGKDKLGQTYITNHSGHYQPSKDTLEHAKDRLSEMGVAAKKVEAWTLKHRILQMLKVL